MNNPKEKSRKSLTPDPSSMGACSLYGQPLPRSTCASILVSVGKQDFPAHPFHILFTVTASARPFLSLHAAQPQLVGHHRASNPVNSSSSSSLFPNRRESSNHLSRIKSSVSEYAVRASRSEYSLRIRVPFAFLLHSTRHHHVKILVKSGIIHPFPLTLFSLLRLHLPLGSLSCLSCANPRIGSRSCRAEELTPSQGLAA